MSRNFRFTSNRLHIEDMLEKGAKAALLAGVLSWQGALLRQFQGERTGRRYRIPGTKVYYTASAETESPANPTGATRRSYTTEVREKKGEAYLGSPEDVAMWLERGTEHMKPRKALQPAAIRERATIEAAMITALRQNVGGSSGGQ